MTRKTPPLPEGGRLLPTKAMPTTDLTIPAVSWDVVRNRLQEHWVAREAPHISIMAKTRAGKSYLARHGILPLCRNDRVLFVDVKGNDPTLNGLGHAVREIPSRLHNLKQLFRGSEPEDHWYRLIIHRGPQNAARAQDQVRTAFDRVLKEGDWVVIIDELRSITDYQYPGLHLKPYYEEFILRGGSRGIATASLSQEPRWCPGAFYTQPNFFFFSRIEDEAAQKRLAEVGSRKDLVPIISKIPRFNWLYMDDMTDTGDRYWARTKVVK